MLILPLEEAKPGMKLVMTVSHPEHPEQDLLKPGFILDDLVIGKLKAMEVPFVYVDYPGLEDLDRLLMPHLSPARQMIYSQIKNTFSAVQKTARPTVTFPDYYAATRELVLTLLSQGQHPIYLDVMSARLGSDAVGHATAVAQLSLTIGIRLEQYLINQRKRLPLHHAKEVVNLGVAGMLHDIGKVKLPRELQQYAGTIPPEKDKDRKEWEEHPRIGRDMLMQGIEPSALAAVMHHHQHFDGSGFPMIVREGDKSFSMAESRIHIFARIIMTADIYERLGTAPDGRKRHSVEILHVMRTEYAAWIDPHIMKMLSRIVLPFPPGIRVTLSDGTLAIVTGVNPDKPYRPTVKRLAEDRWTATGEPVSLVEDTSLSIHALEDVNVEQMLEPVDPPKATPSEAAKLVA